MYWVSVNSNLILIVLMFTSYTTKQPSVIFSFMWKHKIIGVSMITLTDLQSYSHSCQNIKIIGVSICVDNIFLFIILSNKKDVGLTSWLILPPHFKRLNFYSVLS